MSVQEVATSDKLQNNRKYAEALANLAFNLTERTATFKVVVKLDNVEGWGFKATDFHKLIGENLNQVIPHYLKTVTQVHEEPKHFNYLVSVAGKVLIVSAISEGAAIETLRDGSLGTVKKADCKILGVLEAVYPNVYSAPGGFSFEEA